MASCCTCNGGNARCVRCTCVKNKRPCLNCLPGRTNNCHNTITQRQSSVVAVPAYNNTDIFSHLRRSLRESPLTSISGCDVETDVDTLSLSPSAPLTVSMSDTDVTDIDQYMMTGFGATLDRSEVPIASADEWVRRWVTITHLKGKLYHVPGGSVGRKYVELLSLEVSHLAAGNFPSERLMVFSTVVLQRDRLVRKGLDIRRVLERRLVLWSNEEFDLLVDEAVRCDRTIRVNIHKVTEDHFVSVFTRLMLHGKTRAAVRWLSDYSKGRVLPSDSNVEFKDTEGEVLKTTVLDVLKKKHPESQSPPVSTLLKCDPLPPRLDLEVTGAHIHLIASRIQGSAGPSGTDAGHWQDVLLRYGAHSNRLRDSVAALVRRLSNSAIPWEDVRALVACRLVALDKCPGVRPIGVGETLRRTAGKTVCMLTRYDLEEVYM